MSFAELADLAQLDMSDPLEPVSADLWTSRSPVLLPPSPIPGQRNAPTPIQSFSPIFPRSQFGLCANKSGDVYFYGGVTDGPSSVLYHYSITDNTVTPLQCWGASPGSRVNPAMGLAGDIIAIHGGNSLDGSLYLLNLVSREWSKIAASGNSPGDLGQHTMATTGTAIYIFGGYGPSFNDSDKLWAFNLNTLHTPGPTWELIKPSSQERPTARYATSLISYQNQLILFGGYNVNGSLHDIWSFDPKSKRWSELQCTGDIPLPRVRHAVAILDDVMYIIGGSHTLIIGALKDIFAFKIPETWFRLRNMDIAPFSHRYHASVCMGAKIVIFGGDLGKASEEHGIHILNANYINNPSLHMPECLNELDIKFQAMLIQAKEEEGRKESELECKTERLKRSQVVSHILEYPSRVESLARLQRADAQMIVDFLADELGRQDILQSNSDRRHILHFLTKLAKSTQTFPKCTELSDVQCVLTNPSYDGGGYGFIYKGVFRDQTVCVKAVRAIGSGTRAARMLRAQAGELVLLAHVSHPNVIPLYGAYLSSEAIPRTCIVSPWMENGDLSAYLENFPNTSKILFACDIAAGLDFLHDMGIIHADLKAANVLVSGSRRAMLADFGVATILHTNVGTTTAGDFAGTAYWMAPELLIADDHSTPTKQSDMWGFACICYEMFTGDIPFINHYQRPVLLVMAFAKGRTITPLRPKKDGNPISVDDESWVPLAEKCWSFDPDEGPTTTEALRFLTELNAEDDQPSMDEELATFKAIKDSRVRVDMDYSRVLSLVQC